MWFGIVISDAMPRPVIDARARDQGAQRRRAPSPQRGADMTVARLRRDAAAFWPYTVSFEESWWMLIGNACLFVKKQKIGRPIAYAHERKQTLLC